MPILHFTLAGTRYDTAREAVREWERSAGLDKAWLGIRIGVVMEDRTAFINPQAIRVEKEREVGNV